MPEASDVPEKGTPDPLDANRATPDQLSIIIAEREHKRQLESGGQNPGWPAEGLYMQEFRGAVIAPGAFFHRCRWTT